MRKGGGTRPLQSNLLQPKHPPALKRLFRRPGLDRLIRRALLQAGGEEVVVLAGPRDSDRLGHLVALRVRGPQLHLWVAAIGALKLNGERAFGLNVPPLGETHRRAAEMILTAVAPVVRQAKVSLLPWARSSTSTVKHCMDSDAVVGANAPVGLGPGVSVTVAVRVSVAGSARTHSPSW